MGERDLPGLVRFVVDAATLVWQGPRSELGEGWRGAFGEELPAECVSLPLGAEGELRTYGGQRFVVVHFPSDAAQIRRAPGAVGGVTKLDRLIGGLVGRMLGLGAGS